MYQCPISFFTKNIIFNQDKSAWAVYKLSGFDYDFLDDDRTGYTGAVRVSEASPG